MFRQASLVLGVIVLIAGVNCRPCVREADDEVKAGTRKEPEKKLEEFEQFDIGGLEDPPDDFGMGPLIEEEARKKQAEKAKAARTVREKEKKDDGKAVAHGSGFGGRGSGWRKKMLAHGGGTVHVERTIAAAFVWLAKHQSSDGSWSLHDYTRQCTDKTCTGQSDISSDAGATALGLLPFLAAGQTHISKGRYQEHVRKGIEWLISHQQPDGDLARGSTQMMYGHGLATIALSEAYGLSGDGSVGEAAQQAVNFIVAPQNPKDGGWRYNPKEPSDTSVFGWQLMALKCVKMAGLKVDGSVITNARKYLDSVALRDGTEYAYQPGVASSPAMTAVGLLCRQYLGARRDNPMLVGGMAYLLNHLPDEKSPNIYYWYHAHQVMRNMNGYEWDTWNRKIRDLLVRTQVRDANRCDNGSWDPGQDAWGKQGGRLMKTSLSVLPLQVYYHWLPFFRPFDAFDEGTSQSQRREVADLECGDSSPL